MARSAILPSSESDPSGTDSLERRAIKDFKARLKRCAKAYIAALDQIPAEPTVNAVVEKQRYTYRLDASLLRSILSNADFLVDEILMEGGERNLWFFDAYVSAAATRGTAQEFANLAQQSPVYRAGRQSVADILRTEPYQRRMGLLRAREFEEMKSLSGQVKGDMARILTDGVGRGLNPLEVARTMTDQLGVENFRARRIARTEINTALRRARWDESQEADELYGLNTRELHISALSPTTRRTHAARHGLLFDRDDVRDWYSRDANAIQCKCTQVSVMVDNNGDPLVPAIVERAKRTKQIMKERGEGPWTED